MHIIVGFKSTARRIRYSAGLSTYTLQKDLSACAQSRDRENFELMGLPC
jgi:hypothetical protein